MFSVGELAGKDVGLCVVLTGSGDFFGIGEVVVATSVGICITGGLIAGPDAAGLVDTCAGGAVKVMAGPLVYLT